jgi:ankyrin repeat protein
MIQTINTFFQNYLLHPFSDELSKRNKAICAIASGIIFLLSAGLVHIGCALYFWATRDVTDHTGSPTQTQKKTGQAAGFTPKPDPLEDDIETAYRKTDKLEQSISMDIQRLIKSINTNAQESLKTCDDEDARKHIIQNVRRDLKKIAEFIDEIEDTETDPLEDIRVKQELFKLFREARSGNSKDISVLKKFIKEDSNRINLPCDGSGGSVLHGLAKFGRPVKLVKILADLKCNFNQRDSIFKNTPLIWAIANANNTMALELMKYDQDFNTVSHGNTALTLAIAKGYTTHSKDGKKLESSNLDIVKALVDKGIDLTIQTRGDNTALHLACARRDHSMIKTLLDAGATTNIKNENGQTAKEMLELSFREAKKVIDNAATPNILFQETHRDAFTVCQNLFSAI